MLVAHAVAARFRQHVLTHRMHIGAEAPGIADFAGTDGAPHPAEGLLPHLIDGLGIHTPGAQYHLEALTKIRYKVRLRHRIPGPQATQVVFIERKEFHWSL